MKLFQKDTTDTTYAGKTINEINKTAITENWSNVAIDPAGDGLVTDMNGDTPPVAWALIGNLSANEGAYVDLTIKLNPGEFNGKNNVYHNTFSNSVNETVTTTEEHSVVRSLEGLTWKDDNADGVQDSGESHISDVKVSLLKLREGTTFTTCSSDQGSDDANIYLNLDKMLTGISDASNLKKIRIVASGITVGIYPQLFYETDSIGLSEACSMKSLSTTTVETEYVYDTSKFNNWSGSITCLRWDPVYGFNQSFTLKSITFDLADSSTREFDFTKEGAYSEYLTFYNLLFVKVGIDPNNEADYVPYCYPGTSTPVSVETGKQISVLAQSDAVAYEDGRYKFNYLPAGIFAVKFQDGTRTISNYIASPANRESDVTKDSNGIATYSDDRSQLLKTVITGIEMPKAEEMPVVCLESKYNDSGFYERGYELPKSGGAGAEIYTAGGFLMLTLAAFVLLYKHFRRIKRGL